MEDGKNDLHANMGARCRGYLDRITRQSDNNVSTITIVRCVSHMRHDTWNATCNISMLVNIHKDKVASSRGVNDIDTP